MHDDDNLNEQDFVKPERYWTEDDWEKRLIEDEALADRYQQVFEQAPNRVWHDPMDLYMKVHHGIDLGEHFKECEWDDEEYESEYEDEDELDMVNSAGEDQEVEYEDLEEMPVYRLAFDFAFNVHEFLKRTGQASNMKEQLDRHARRVPADIAAGHGLGYEEDVLCGNIVKNRWALNHASKALKAINILIDENGLTKDLRALYQNCQSLCNELQNRINSLRSKVWWA